MRAPFVAAQVLLGTDCLHLPEDDDRTQRDRVIPRCGHHVGSRVAEHGRPGHPQRIRVSVLDVETGGTIWEFNEASLLPGDDRFWCNNFVYAPGTEGVPFARADGLNTVSAWDAKTGARPFKKSIPGLATLRRPVCVPGTTPHGDAPLYGCSGEGHDRGVLHAWNRIPGPLTSSGTSSWPAGPANLLAILAVGCLILIRWAMAESWCLSFPATRPSLRVR